MDNELIDQGLTLMLAGMGTVFVFLTALVVAMSVMSNLLARVQTTTSVADVTDDEIAAITAAVAKHRQK
ncbi:sodium pump decarboxylase subunit gamma [Gammaproteobacteria bacterium]|jgi:oxaloacetate decarboxylase gamma subunit|nr:sodium pump decarboxylase subunit gamma [Gammaproteobacteria bacterium]